MGKTWTEKLLGVKDTPKIVEVKKEMMGAKCGQKMLIASPLEYQEEMRKIPVGKLTTLPIIRAHLAEKHLADITCPLTAGIFVNIVANAAVETNDDIPWWRTLKGEGELNIKFPGGLEIQAEMLTKEGHKILKKGKRWFVEGYSDYLA